MTMNAEPHIFGRREFNTENTDPEREGFRHRCRVFPSVISAPSVLKKILNKFPNP